MLTMTHIATPEKLNERFKPINIFTPPNSAAELKSNQLLQTKNQMTRQDNPFYIKQGTEIRKAVLG